MLKEMGIPNHLTCLLRNLYSGQETTVRTQYGTMDWFKTGKGVRQGCLLSPCLFNLHAEYIVQLNNKKALVGQSVQNPPATQESVCSAEDPAIKPGRSAGGGNGNPLQYSCLENPMDRGDWRATVHRVARVGHDLALNQESVQNLEDNIPFYPYTLFFNIQNTTLFFSHFTPGFCTLNYCVQFSSVAQSCPNLCDPMNYSTPGLPVQHQLPEFTQTHVHRVSDAIQSSHTLSSPSPPAPNLSQYQGLFQQVNSLHQVAKVSEFQPQHQSF